MARPIQRIEREIAELEMAIASLATEFYRVYCNYARNLGRAVRGQLILATYHICTQTYPQVFLDLSLSARQKLQEAIKTLGTEAEAAIIESVSRPRVEPDALPVEEQEYEENSAVDIVPADPDLPAIDKPDELARWQQGLERQIADVLEHASEKVNQQLKKSGVVTNDLPEALIELAAHASSSHDTIPTGPPNILNLAIEAETFLPPHRKGESKIAIELPEKLLKEHKELGAAVILGLEKIGYEEDDDEEDEDDDDREESSGLPFSLPLKLVLVNLRLSDIEFADPNVTVERNQLRQLQDKFRKIQQSYEQKQQEYAIAQAEAAWRSSWMDEG
ncbi:hypothetical protein [Roseofilum casamattae]|uniref:Uncharacterized protein n=1 Tax=Roseofilum casamattae BLCC-M143 TaxID=3022442 RepID=A0ABT7BYC0_9CYAN|nr:hypothetical protein [Roseofilum casamattae]MDJ1184202.1 hypothetical protein [Roseofilum casamattae BLCC-M143]